MKEEKNSEDIEKKKHKNKLDKQLDQSFPASDPPAQTRPGHDRAKKKRKTVTMSKLDV